MIVACVRPCLCPWIQWGNKKKTIKWTRKVKTKTVGTRLIPHSENTFQKHSERRKVLRFLNKKNRLGLRHNSSILIWRLDKKPDPPPPSTIKYKSAPLVIGVVEPLYSWKMFLQTACVIDYRSLSAMRAVLNNSIIAPQISKCFKMVKKPKCEWD